MDSVDLDTFPSNKFEAIAYLYVKSQDLSDKTPEQIYTMYLTALYKIKDDHAEKRRTGFLR